MLALDVRFAGVPFAGVWHSWHGANGHRSLPEERPEIYDKTETLARIGNITALVLIQHGNRDVRTPFLNFELAVAVFDEHGIEYEAHTYPEGHGFRDPDNRIALYRRVEEFFTRHLGACR